MDESRTRDQHCKNQEEKQVPRPTFLQQQPFCKILRTDTYSCLPRAGIGAFELMSVAVVAMSGAPTVSEGTEKIQVHSQPICGLTGDVLTLSHQ